MKKTTDKVKLVPYKAPSIAAFKKMNVANKRITIAKDIIAAVNGKIYKAYIGRYVNNFVVRGSTKEVEYMNSEWGKRDIQATIPEIEECEVCAMGACIMSITKYKNKLKFSDLGKISRDISTDTTDLIKEVFTPLQLCMIEIMFEGYYSDDSSNLAHERYNVTPNTSEINACENFYDWYIGYPDERMKAIMEHIIANKGEVLPENMNPKTK